MQQLRRLGRTLFFWCLLPLPLAGGKGLDMINNWTDEVVATAERRWGNTCPGHVADMVLSINDGESVLDLGCGFGRLLDLLEIKDYMGYDSSEAMVKRFRKKWWKRKDDVVCRDILKPFDHTADVVIAINVFIHLTTGEQRMVLENIRYIYPKRVVFNIHSEESEKDDFVEIAGVEFRNHRNNLDSFEVIVNEIFGENYAVERNDYRLRKGRVGHIFILSKEE